MLLLPLQILVEITGNALGDNSPFSIDALHNISNSILLQEILQAQGHLSIAGKCYRCDKFILPEKGDGLV